MWRSSGHGVPESRRCDSDISTADSTTEPPAADLRVIDPTTRSRALWQKSPNTDVKPAVSLAGTSHQLRAGGIRRRM